MIIHYTPIKSASTFLKFHLTDYSYHWRVSNGAPSSSSNLASHSRGHLSRVIFASYFSIISCQLVVFYKRFVAQHLLL